MLDVDFIRQNPEIVKNGIAKKNVDPKLVDRFLYLDLEWREKTTLLNQLKSEQNKLNKELAQNKTDDRINRAKILKDRIADLNEEKKKIDEKRIEILYKLPNLPLEDVPIGKDDSENKVLKIVGNPTKFDFEPKDYLILSEKIDLVDVERASKVSGSRFGYLKNEAALMEFAIIKLVFDTLLPEGFIPVVTPALIKQEMMKAMGFLDRHEDEAETYFLPQDNLYLIGTAEQSLGPMHAREVFNYKDLPKRYIGFSSCFRREAGSYGKDTKGIFRVHQFDKLEMFSFTKPEDSEKEHQLFLSLEEKLMSSLEIPYRVINICTGDLGNVAAKKYDIEAWFPGQNQYRETHSTSNVTDYQARRLNIHYKDSKGKLHLVHMINGTAFAIGRILIAIFENYQNKDGSITIPKVLQGYLGKEKIVPRYE
ncbi:MAG: serine--tRNA ligase [Minisyncoccia bacterium]